MRTKSDLNERLFPFSVCRLEKLCVANVSKSRSAYIKQQQQQKKNTGYWLFFQSSDSIGSKILPSRALSLI